MLTRAAYTIRAHSLWVAIVISVILHVALLFNAKPQLKSHRSFAITTELEILLNEYSEPQTQAKPQTQPQEKTPQQKSLPVPVQAPRPESNKVVRSKIVKPKLAPPLSSSQVQTEAEIASNKEPTTIKESLPAQADKNLSRDREIQKMKADYLAKLAQWLNRHKRYPAVARRRGQEGEILVRFSTNAEGKLLSHKIVSPAAHASLNAAVVKMLKASSPMPAIPTELRNGKTEFEYTIPVQFKLTGKS